MPVHPECADLRRIKLWQVVASWEASSPTTFAAFCAASRHPAVPRTFKLGKLVTTTFAPARPTTKVCADSSWERIGRHDPPQLEFLHH